MSEEKKQGPFNRRVDKRFVKKVVAIQHMPKNWVRMNIVDFEAKIMEIKKYSSSYFDLESKINSPGYQIISAYNVQNPFLMGSYMLRKEQMQMQLGKGKMKERYLFLPIKSFNEIDKMCRMNLGSYYFRIHRETIMTFFIDAEKAMDLHDRNFPDSNPRALLYVRVLLGQCSINNGTKKQFFETTQETGLPINSWVDEDHKYIHKLTQSNDEVYPESLILYRRRDNETDGPGDSHQPRLESFLSSAVTLSYGAGKRYNPEEAIFKGKSIRRKKSSKTDPQIIIEEKNLDDPNKTEAVIESIPMTELSISKE